jgi:hypothetical protein
MRERIAHYRREPIGPHDDPEIGCVFIRDVAFFPDDLTFDPPPGFASNIVQGKGYDMGDPAVAGYFGDLMQLVLGRPLPLEVDLSSHGTQPDRSSASRDWRLTAWRSRHSRLSSWTPTTGDARSPGPRSAQSWKRRTSAQ